MKKKIATKKKLDFKKVEKKVERKEVKPEPKKDGSVLTGGPVFKYE